MVMGEMFCRILGRYITYVGETTYKMPLLIQGILFDLDMRFQDCAEISEASTIEI